MPEKPRILGQSVKRKIDCAHCASGESSACDCPAFCGKPICSWRIAPRRLGGIEPTGLRVGGTGLLGKSSTVPGGGVVEAPPSHPQATLGAAAPMSLKLSEPPMTGEEAAYYVSLMRVENVVKKPSKQVNRPSSRLAAPEETGPSRRIMEDFRKTQGDNELPGFPSGWTLGRDPWPYDTGKKRKGDV